MRDQAVEEVRERRRRLIKEQYHGSVRELVADAVQWGATHPDKVRSLRRRGKRAAA